MLDLRRFRGLDTETTGVDLYHGALPFFVTTARLNGSQLYWEWDVDPITRKPIVPKGDLRDIRALIADTPGWVLQNPKFDVTALAQLGVDGWPWAITHDTLIASHLVASNAHHDLTSSALMYLGLDLQPYEDALEKAVKMALAIVKRKYPEWKVAKKGTAGMPSAKEKVWKYDTWLPRAVAKAEGYDDDHPWWTVLSEYGNSDSVVLLPLLQKLLEIIDERELTKIYYERLKAIPIAYEMEKRGVTLSEERLDEMMDRCHKESVKAGNRCRRIAIDYDYELDLPKGGLNNSLRSFIFEQLDLPVVSYTKKGGPSLDKRAMEQYQLALDEGTKPREFIDTLLGKRERDTAISYMDSYKRYWRPFDKTDMVLHPNLNQTGTDTLRWSCANPNEQNISKKKGLNLRYCFGPAKGREWWSLDYDNLELRIPAYECGENAMIEIFEKPDEPPYWGSYHLLNASIVYADLFWPLAEQKGAFRDKYSSTYYQWIKNFGFSLAYGAVDSSGTADRAAHKQGAQRMVMDRLTEHTNLNQKMIQYANKYGYVETIPDRDIDPNHGYPLLCTRSQWGAILPTVPLNYHVQGTACWVVMRAMIKVQEYFDELNASGKDQYYIIMNVHDELVLDFPYRPKYGNLPKAKQVRRLMESVGEPIGVPLTCGLNYHQVSWDSAVSL